MRDIVERLRELAYSLTIPSDEVLVNEAADEIIRLRAALAEAERKYHQNLTELAQVHLKELDRRDANLAAALERQK